MKGILGDLTSKEPRFWTLGFLLLGGWGDTTTKTKTKKGRGREEEKKQAREEAGGG